MEKLKNKINKQNEIIGNKAENLIWLKEFVEKLENKKILVPNFITISANESIENKIDEIIKLFNGKKLAIRSSSPHEDTHSNSMAGAYETVLNVNPTKEDIIETYKQIQNNSVKKFGHKIPVVVQEMVNNIKFSGVIFSLDPDNNKPYIILNYHNGIGEDLVSGNSTGQTEKYLKIKYENSKNWKYQLVNLIQKIEKEYGKPVDVEFAIDNDNNIRLLQVRPITTINSQIKIDKLTEKYSKFIKYIIEKNDLVMGDMIDINPEELVGNQPLLTKTFFYWLFVKNALKESRKQLGYGYDHFGFLILDKPYIDLERNLKSFLPSTLTKEEIKVFLNYYKTLITNNISLQKELDSKFYPINITVLKQILEKIEIDENLKKSIINKFSKFFQELEFSLPKKLVEYEQIEKQIFKKIGITNYYELINLTDINLSLKELLELIIFVSKNFADFARAAFYRGGKGYKLTNGFKKHFYLNQIAKQLPNGTEKIKFKLSNGFNFLEEIEQEYNIKKLENELKNLDFIEDITPFDIGQLGRENFKFILFNLLRIFKNKILNIIKNSTISNKDKSFIIKNLNYLSFEDLLNFIDGKKDIKYLKNRIQHNQKKEEIRKILELPSVVDKDNNIIEIKKFDTNGYFIGEGIIKGKTYFLDNLSKLSNPKIIENIKGKILLVENATPEIDFILQHVKAIVTKNGGPLAHIVIRAREFGIPVVVGIGNNFNNLKRHTEIKIDFDKKNIEII